MRLAGLDIPVVETRRMVLRGPQEEDFEAFAAFGASERSRHVGGPYPRFRSWGGFLATYGHWALRGYGMWIAALRDNGTPVGRIGFIFNDGWDEPELGWQVFEGFEGKGLAAEAARAARHYGAAHLDLDGVVSYIAPDNHRSVALAERLGAVQERKGKLIDSDVLVYRHPREAA